MNETLTNKDALNDTVCAVVVTYNRKILLLECLEALLKQTKPINAIYIIDNFSTDDTPGALQEKGYILELPPEKISEPWEKEFEIRNLTNGQPVKIHYVRMNENTGGAGGFHEGVKRGYERGYGWLWLMDDDVVAECAALENLLKGVNSVPDAAFLCSRVISPSGNQMNVPEIDLRPSSSYYPDWGAFLDRGLVKVRSATFVSVIVPSNTIEDIGLPIKEFFIWGDDTEFTLRATQNRPAYIVGNSVVVHLRTIEAPPSVIQETDPVRICMHFYSMRNSFYCFKQYRSKRRLFYFTIEQLYMTIKVLFAKKYRLLRARTILSGLVAGIFFNPQVCYVTIVKRVFSNISN